MTPESTAPAWEKHDDFYRTSWRPVFDWLCREADVGPGKRVLDIATGTGLPARPAAVLAGPGGHVLGVDVDEQMLEAARRRSAAEGLDNVEFRAMDAHALDAPDATFDAVTFGFGLMFCSDPDQVLREIHRVLAPGGRFAIAVWDAPEKCAFLTSMFAPLAELSDRPPPAAGGPGPFRFANPAALEAVVRAGGFSALRIESVPMTATYDSVDHYWEVSTELAAPVRNMLAALDADGVASIRARVSENVAPFIDGGRVLLSATPLCAAGRK